MVHALMGLGMYHVIRQVLGGLRWLRTRVLARIQNLTEPLALRELRALVDYRAMVDDSAVGSTLAVGMEPCSRSKRPFKVRRTKIEIRERSNVQYRVVMERMVWAECFPRYFFGIEK